MQESKTSEEPSYRVYTTKFDQVVTADQLDSAIGALGMRGRAQVDAAWAELQNGLLPWRIKLQIECEKLGKAIRSALSDEERNNTVVTLLWDNSGSMRGQKMLYSAATADVAQEFLTTLGIACEVLGFTTSAWRGGRSRKRWTWRFRPRNPGRLNDLLHVVFRDAGDNRVSTGDWSYRQMLRPDYPKDNIDGEAIEWAAQRLRSIPKQRRILIVLSDGAPVDDSTLNENGPTYLRDHLQVVVERLTQENEIVIASFGVGFKPHPFYTIGRHVDDPANLGSGLLELLRDLLVSQLDG